MDHVRQAIWTGPSRGIMMVHHLVLLLLLSLLPVSSSSTMAGAAEVFSPQVSVKFVHHPQRGAGLAVADRSNASTSADDLHVLILINSRHAANCSWSTAQSTPRACFVTVPSPPRARRVPAAAAGLAQVAVYARGGSIGRLQLLSVVEGGWSSPETAGSSPYVYHTWQTVSAKLVLGRPRILLYNTVEAVPQALAAQSLQRGSRVTTVENLVQSNGTITCSSLKGNCGLYHATPLINGIPSYYCWWRRRRANSSCPASLSNPCVDCPNISSNALFLADLWHRTGIDVIVPDTTNLRHDNEANDELNGRPVEVLAEELAALRLQGMETPQLAPWTVAAANTTVYKSLLRVINSPRLASLLLREPVGKRAVFFVHGDAPNPADPGTVANIESNGGAHNVSAIEMWANINPADAQRGVWTFFQPCQRTAEPGDFTDTIGNDPYFRCNHLKTADKPQGGGLGSQMSAAMSWQSSQTSLAWSSPSKRMGLTFQAMIDDVLREKPQNIMLPSFDEWNAGPRPIDSMFWQAQGTVGFPYTEQHVAFLDTFGAERSRSWAPTVEAGTFYLELTQSCLRVVALATASGATSCENFTGELCCERKYSQFTPVYSLHNDNRTDYLPTASHQEATILQQQGKYAEICASSLGPYASDIFCYKPGETDFQARMGPFELYSLSAPPPQGHASLLHTSAARIAIYRCNDGGIHFVSVDGACEGAATEQLLGYASAVPHTGMPRKLRRCERPDRVRYHTLDAPCASTADRSAVLGHVL